MATSLNLLRTEPYEDGQRRYVGMYETKTNGPLVGGPEAIGRTPEKVFDLLREQLGDVKILVRSEDLPAELTSRNWYKDRVTIGRSELTAIVKSQQKGGQDVELAA